MKAVILAAGRGSRLGSLTDDKPKCLVEISGQSLLSLQYKALAKAGIEGLSVVAGYQGDKFPDYVEHLIFNPHWQQSNMVRSLLCAQSILQQHPTIVSYADIFYSAETVERLIHCSSDADIVIAYDPQWWALWSQRSDNPLDDTESFRFDAKNRLIEIGQAVADREKVMGQYMGLLFIRPFGWSKINRILSTLSEEDINNMDMTSLLALCLERGTSVEVVEQVGGWGEVDTPSDVALYEELLNAGRFTFINET